MSWRDLRNARTAQLGNARFLVESGEAEFGRKTVLHRYPMRDRHYVEDLSRDTRTFTIEAYVIGADYMAARDAVIAEVERRGPHTLVHPYFGELQVDIVGRVRVQESTREGGMARITIPCIEAGELVFPSAAIATQEQVATLADSAIAAVEEEGAESFVVQRIPSFVPDAATDLVDGLVERMDEITNTITTLPDVVPQFLSALNELSVSASSLILAPATLAGKITDAIAQFNVIAARPQASLDVLKELFGFGDDLPVVNPMTPSRAQQADNQAAFTTLVQRAAVIEATRASASVAFDSYDTAVDTRDELIAALDAQAELADDDSVYYALTGLKAAMINDIAARGANLARIIERELNAPLPSLALAYDLYGDVELEEDVLTRNRVRDPLFVPSGATLEVLANV